MGCLFSKKKKQQFKTDSGVTIKKQIFDGFVDGLVWNDSPFLVEYYVYGNFQEKGHEQHCKEIDPRVQVGLNIESLKLKLIGFKKTSTSHVFNKFGHSSVVVQPNRVGTSGLSKLKMTKHKISVRIVIDEFQKFIVNDVTINDPTDMCLKVQDDGAILNMRYQEALQIIDRSQNGSKFSTTTDRKSKILEACIAKLPIEYQKKLQKQNKKYVQAGESANKTRSTKQVQAREDANCQNNQQLVSSGAYANHRNNSQQVLS